jgi:hypothetical protein
MQMTNYRHPAKVRSSFLFLLILSCGFNAVALLPAPKVGISRPRAP